VRGCGKGIGADREDVGGTRDGDRWLRPRVTHAHCMLPGPFGHQHRLQTRQDGRLAFGIERRDGGYVGGPHRPHHTRQRSPRDVRLVAVPRRGHHRHAHRQQRIGRCPWSCAQTHTQRKGDAHTHTHTHTHTYRHTHTQHTVREWQRPGMDAGRAHTPSKGPAPAASSSAASSVVKCGHAVGSAWACSAVAAVAVAVGYSRQAVAASSHARR
jgi:hypothetical protein